MPYFIQYNILFIHIPKTGGTSVEKYFKKKLKMKLSKKHLYSPFEIFNGHSYQHLTYSEIYLNRELFNVYFNERMLLFAVVRNPYERMISELFYQKLINKTTSPIEVEKILNNYLNSKEHYDNHKLPQYLFILDIDGNINKNIIILKTENLNNDMKKLGFTDFNINTRKTYRNELNYYDYLTNNSINTINNYYSKDFEIFNYEKMNVNIIERMNNKNSIPLNILSILLYILLIILYVITIILSNVFGH